ncbi:hypothetical protein NIES4102_00180 [Chondrocystis sp. NIES-4102]|nr:hypothetical protein NIES4102_00180 [Chondrocystis sp. NIES-4102]
MVKSQGLNQLKLPYFMKNLCCILHLIDKKNDKFQPYIYMIKLKSVKFYYVFTNRSPS